MVNLMKIVVISDNHGDRDIIQRIVNIHKDADLYLHCGDSQMFEHEIYPFISVKGNNDFGKNYPMELYFDTPCGKLYMCHGNFLFGITPQLVESKKCKIFLYGHIHRQRIQNFNNTYAVCPGSTSYPRGNDEPSYLVIEFDNQNEPIFNFRNL